MQRIIVCCLCTLLMFIAACKKEKENNDTTQYPAILPFKTAGMETYGVGMIRNNNGRFTIQLVDKQEGGLRHVGKLISLDIAPSSKNLISSTAHLFDATAPIGGSLFYDKTTGNSFSLMQIKAANDTTVFLFFNRFNDVLLQLQLRNFSEANFDLAKMIPVTDGYLFIGSQLKNNQRDVCVIRYSKNLNRVWMKTFGGNLNDAGMDGVELCDNNYGILAYTYSIGAGDRDVWYLKLSPNGDFISGTTYGGSGYEEPQQIISNGCDVYIAGHSSSFGNPEHHGYLLKIDNNGTKIWENTYGTSNHDGFQTVTFTADKSGLIAAGRSMQSTTGPEDLFVVCTDLNGNEQWRKKYGEADLTENPVSIITDEEFYYVLCNRIDLTGKFGTVFIKDKLPN